MPYTAHVDTFARDHLPPPEAQPEFRFDLPELQFPERLNCATELLDRHVKEGRGDRPCVSAPGGRWWTYADLQRQADRIAHVLVEECGLVPGNRVLLRAANRPMLVACWFAVMKAGGIAVATMPMLRAKELGQIIAKAQVSIALCDVALRAELDTAAAQTPAAAGDAATPMLARIVCFGDTANAADADRLEARMVRHQAPFTNVDTAATDTCLFAFTSGTTGQPKATMHFHRDVMASCVCFPPHVLRAAPDDVFIGSPPLAFTFGLGGLTVFPMHIGASTVLLEKAGPPDLLEAIAAHRATVCVTAPTSYRAMAAGAREKKLGVRDGGPLRKCIAAGEALPAATRALWKDATGIEIIDGIGATEMFHIFIAADEAHARPGATGTAVPGYRARVVDDEGNDVPAGTIGRLAVQGPTGCRYLSDPRQADYVKGGWNYTGDAYLQDADGYFFYQSRTDDMIISAGYNIAAVEVEDVLLRHEAVAECAVIGAPDEERGQIVKAFVVLRSGHAADEAMVKGLQDFVKATVAPYKYPRAVEFRGGVAEDGDGEVAEVSAARDMNARSTSGALLVLLAATACTPGPEPYGVIRDAGLSPDGKTLLVLIEHGTKTTARGNIFRGDITTARPASMRIHGFDRSSGNLGPVSSQPPPAEANAAGDRLDRYAAVTGGTVASLKDCRALYTPCAEATVPNPYRVGGLIVDPQGRRSIEWNGERLVVAPFQALDPAQIRIAREALFRRSVERMRSAATQDFAARATKEDPERITTGEAGTAERDPGMTAFYQLLPGRVTMARFDYGGTTQFAVVWQRDGACVTDSVAVAALIAGCHGTDAPGLERAARGIPRTRPPDPDRMGTTWGVIDGSDMPPGTVTVACHGQPTQTAAKPCDERQGDTACRSALPMLCSKADAALPPRSSLARRLALTAPVRGTELLSVGAADKVCQAALGEGWRMTDGEEAGNKYQVTGIGNVPATSRFWVRAGEGSANCW